MWGFLLTRTLFNCFVSANVCSLKHTSCHSHLPSWHAHRAFPLRFCVCKDTAVAGQNQQQQSRKKSSASLTRAALSIPPRRTLPASRSNPSDSHFSPAPVGEIHFTKHSPLVPSRPSPFHPISVSWPKARRRRV